MKAIVSLKSVSRSENCDTIKFIDDASQELPPIITRQGGAKDGEKRHARALRWDKEAGKLSISTRNGGAPFAELRGEIQRTDSWDFDEETGEIEASASLTFRCEGRLTKSEIADLFGSENLCIEFKPSQQAISFSNDDVAKVAEKAAESLSENTEIIHDGKTYKGKKKDAA